MLAIAGVVLGLHVFWDGPPPDDADLMPDPIPLVAPEDSVRAGLVELYARMQATQPEGWVHDDDLHHWIEEEAGSPGSATLAPLDRSIWTPELACRFDPFLPWIDHHLAELDAILARPAHGSWIPHDDYSMIHGLREVRKLVKVLRGRALLARMQGDLAQAYSHLERIRRLAESFLHAGTSLVELLVGGSLSSMVIADLQALLHDEDVPDELESRWLATLPSCDRDATLVARTLRAEYAIMSNSIHLMPDDLMLGNGFAGRLFLKVNRTRSILAREFRALIDQSELSGPERRREAAPFPQLSPRWRAVLRANSGELFVPWIVLSAEVSLGRVDEFRLSERVLRLLIALRVHERTQGVLPPDLATLVSRGILPADASWIDPLSGNPLRYDPERRILWSVGEDGADDDGAGWQQLRDDPEARYRLPDWVWPIPPLPGN